MLRTWVAEMHAYQRAPVVLIPGVGIARTRFYHPQLLRAYGLGEARKLRRARGPGAIGRMEWKSVSPAARP